MEMFRNEISAIAISFSFMLCCAGVSWIINAFNYSSHYRQDSRDDLEAAKLDDGE